MTTGMAMVMKFIVIFLIASLASEVAAGIINGGGMGNSTQGLITSSINSLIGGVTDLLVSIPITIINFAIAIINGLLGLSIDYLAYP